MAKEKILDPYFRLWKEVDLDYEIVLCDDDCSMNLYATPLESRTPCYV